MIDDDGRVTGILTEGDLMRRSEVGARRWRQSIGTRRRTTRALT
ncbi:hypothetical protein [Mesorhizobium sp. KR9-304]